ncbi:hypothetical protein QBC43DRAFT_323637 [Cladorrhinum sp. PSN259]|nr:hypothetical protein QBC43DRAFT_323637 [Cladorrhinum sp. PSN259]
MQLSSFAKMDQTALSRPASPAPKQVTDTTTYTPKESFPSFEFGTQKFVFKPQTPAAASQPSPSQDLVPHKSSSPPSIFGKGGSANLFGTDASAEFFASMFQQTPPNTSSSRIPTTPEFSFSSASVPPVMFGFGKSEPQSPAVNDLTKSMASFSFPDTSSSPITGNPNKKNAKALTIQTAVESESSDQGEAGSETEVDSDDSTGSTGSITDPSSEAILSTHLGLLDHQPGLDDLNEIKTTPIFTEAVRKHAIFLAGGHTAGDKPFSQYGLLAGDISPDRENPSADPRIFWNIAAPSSFFICGSQGSGKSHTLSCLLENALAPCKANVLPRPLTGIVFHYDTFISDTGGSPCEVAWLSSNKDINVRVLCPPTNFRTMQKLYQRFPRIQVEELRLNESDLNTKRMLDLMAVSTGGNLPLYLHVAQRILRDLRITQQQTNTGFNYTAFKKQLALENLTDMQLAPLKQRLDTLESFMVESQAKEYDMFNSSRKKAAKNVGKPKGTDWTPRNGTLTIVDLSCPCVSAETACSLFNICLSLFLEQESTKVGRVIALDEAHKYMTESQECMTLTESLLATIRLQRHLGARILISTQEPTISPKLLDLCSVTVVHRFTSPDWLHALKRHLAGVSSGGRLLEKAKKLSEARDGDDDDVVQGASVLSLGHEDPALELFSRIVDLRVGEALMFAPSAIVSLKRKGNDDDEPGLSEVRRLAHGVLKVRIRNRTTKDGGRSIMAT